MVREDSTHELGHGGLVAGSHLLYYEMTSVQALVTNMTALYYL